MSGVTSANSHIAVQKITKLVSLILMSKAYGTPLGDTWKTGEARCGSDISQKQK